jgi:3-dehydroquinate synthase
VTTASDTVLVGRGLLTGTGEALAGISRPGPILLVTDGNVAPLYLETVREDLVSAGFRPREAVLPPGEGTKTLDTVRGLYGELLAIGADRATPVLGLGGGVVTDLAGFAAATFLRGLRWAALPTTLLAQVDASVGGKTGVNLPEGKNLVGAFHQPDLVRIDPDTLRTLEPRQYRSGLAEAAKTAIALDAELLEALETHPERYRAPGDPEVLATLVGRCVAAKAAVVELDEREAGPRRVLNFGHTLGHAIEAAVGYDGVLHGEAVAVGMAAAIRLSVRQGLLPEQDGERLVGLLRALELPVEVTDLPVRPDGARVRKHLARDKKRRGGKQALVLLAAPGTARILEDQDADELL